ncbi:hypothetical protein, partial [Rhodococcus sp. NPDC057529]|uniref:hypothetical protein n=1 Tax=Rhodococcus sp. NPDC057529 TaxID=3346158 RepID=UPI0036722897
VTAGNASTINDGACAVVVMSKERAEAEGLTWRRHRRRRPLRRRRTGRRPDLARPVGEPSEISVRE